MEYIILGIVIFIIIVVLLLYRETRIFRVTNYSFRLPAMKGAKLRIVVLADLHGKVYGKDNEPLISAIDEAKPDMIICAGDMITAYLKAGFDGGLVDGKFVSENKQYESAMRFMQTLSGRYPVFFGNGNHESRLYRRASDFGDAYENLVASLGQMGIVHLANESKSVTINDVTVNVYGLDIEGKYYKRGKTPELPADYLTGKLGECQGAFDGTEADKPRLNLLIAHNPDYHERYYEWGADVTFCGHLHGGVMRLPFIGGVISPQFHFFPRYSGDIYPRGNQAIVVSKGIGSHSMPLRIFDRAEVIVLDIC